MKVNIYDIEQFEDGKEYRLHIPVANIEADPELDISKSLVNQHDILEVLINRVGRQLEAQEVLESQAYIFGNSNAVLYGAQPDRSFRYKNYYIEKESMLLVDKRNMIMSGELGIILRDGETKIEIMEAEENVTFFTEGLSILGVVIGVYDRKEHKVKISFDNELADIVNEISCDKKEGVIDAKK